MRNSKHSLTDVLFSSRISDVLLHDDNISSVSLYENETSKVKNNFISTLFKLNILSRGEYLAAFFATIDEQLNKMNDGNSC